LAVTAEISGEIYLDSNVFIYAMEGSDRYRRAVESLLEKAGGTFVSTTSELTIGECLIGAASPQLIALYLDLLNDGETVRTWPITRSIIESAAELGRELGVKLVDAIHVATALVAGCTVFVSNDRRLRLPPQLRKLDLRALAAE
jgi:predicted nucleic acid-binding protein